MWDYSDKVKDHFFNPRNTGEIKDADGVGEVGSLACGDALKLFLKVDKATGTITDARFLTFGCGSAIASSSALTEMIKGLTMDEALKITNKDISDYLDGLPDEKQHCSVMGREALEAAAADYRGETPVKEELEGEIVCKCFGVTDVKIERAVLEDSLISIEEVTHYTKAGGGCGKCLPAIVKIMDSLKPRVLSKLEPMKEAKLTNIQRIRLIENTIEREIRPQLQADGGDIELVDVIGERVIVSLRGTCVECPSSKITIKSFVEKKIKELVDVALVVEQVKHD